MPTVRQCNSFNHRLLETNRDFQGMFLRQFAFPHEYTETDELPPSFNLPVEEIDPYLLDELIPDNHTLLSWIQNAENPVVVALIGRLIDLDTSEFTGWRASISQKNQHQTLTFDLFRRNSDNDRRTRVYHDQGAPNVRVMAYG